MYSRQSPQYQGVDDDNLGDDDGGKALMARPLTSETGVDDGEDLGDDDGGKALMARPLTSVAGVDDGEVALTGSVTIPIYHPYQ